MVRMSAVTRSGASVLLVACFAAACHGGGGDATGTAPNSTHQINASPANMGYTAANPGSPPPSARTVTVTVTPNSGTLFFRIVPTGTAASVENIQMLAPNQVRFTVRPASPATLQAGNHASVITVAVCNTDANCTGAQITGSPITINVGYQVGTPPPTPPPAPPPASLAPSVGAASAAGNVVLRGTGFSQVNSVSFGATPALEFTVMSDTEIRATYPALAAGTLPIRLSASGVPVPFSQSLTLVPAGTLATATLAYTQPVENMRGLAFDPVTQTLFVGIGLASPTSNQVLAYTFASGAWQLPIPATVANLRNLALSLDRTRLPALTDTTVVDLNPATLAQQALPTTLTAVSDPFLKGIVATNDGQAFIVSSSQTAPGQHYLYNLAAHTFTGPTASYSSPEVGGPDNGTRAVIIQSGAQTVQQYNAFTGLVSATPLVLAHFHPVAGRVENINLPAFDRDGNRMLVAGLSGGTAFHAVFDANFSELGRVPSTDVVSSNQVNTAAYALSPDGTRAYILQIGAGNVCRVRAFDLTVSPGPGALYQEVTVVGFPIDLSPISNCPSSGFDQASRILVNPPGDTLFIAGNQKIRVVRLP